MNAKRQDAAVTKRAAVARDCIKKLEAAASALHAYVHACNACEDGSGYRGADDGRTLLASRISEQASWLETTIGKKA